MSTPLTLPGTRASGSPASAVAVPPAAVLGTYHGPALAAGLLAVLVWRFVQVQSLELPAWVDAVHHTLAVRLILEQGRVPESWGPYLPDVPFYYHFGFHVTAALVARLTGWTGVQLGRAVLVAGQLWQVVLAAGVYALALRLWRMPAKALTALILVGFVSQMPAYYVSWGRYTLLAGLALLVWGMAAALAGRGILVGLLLAGTAVTHYYAFVLFLVFLVLLLAASGRVLRLHVAAGAGAGLLLAAPWLFRVWHFTRAFARAPRSEGAAVRASEPQLWNLLGPERNHLLLYVALAGLCLLAFRVLRRRFEQSSASLALLGWVAVQLGLLVWQVGPFRPDHAAIVLFLPAVLLASEALWELLPRSLVWPCVALLAAWGLVETRHIVRGDTVLARSADVAAIGWVDAATPADATFLVDVEPWMGIWRGADGGWWITPLTGRRTVLPPVAYGWGEPELAELIRGNARRTYALKDLKEPRYCAEVQRLMTETGAGFYYTRSRRAAACGNLYAVYTGAGGLGIYGLSLGPRAVL